MKLLTRRRLFKSGMMASLLRGASEIPPPNAELVARWLAGASVASLGLVPVEADAATNFLWSNGGLYNAGRANWLTTEINSLGNTSLAISGSAFQNTSGWIFYDAEFLSGSTITPASGAYVAIWTLRAIDNSGTNYEDGGSSVTPGRPPDASILVRAGTTITPRAGFPRGILPPSYYKVLCQNNLGTGMAASGNVVSYAAYTQQY